MGDLVQRLAGGTLISWADYTFNPWRGCVKVSPACRFCYAERETARWGGDFWGKNADRPIAKTTWRNPAKWNREAAEAGEKRRVFSGSLCDVFEDRDDLVTARHRLFDLIETTEWLIWMLLTKRPENIAKLAARYASGWPPNVWLGTTVESQRFAVERIPHLEQHNVAVRFASSEPLLGPIDPEAVPGFSSLGWVITGGESGGDSRIRPSHPSWYRTLRDYCQDTGTRFHHKQNGVWVDRGQVAVPDRYQGHDWARNPQRHLMLARNGIRKPIGDWDGTEDPELEWARMIRLPRKDDSGRLLDGQVWDQVPA